MSRRLHCCIAVLSMPEVIYIHVGSTVWELWRPNLVVTTGNLTPDQLTTCYTCGRPGWSRKANAAQPCTSYKMTSFKLFSGPENIGHCKKKKERKKNGNHSNSVKLKLRLSARHCFISNLMCWSSELTHQRCVTALSDCLARFQFPWKSTQKQAEDLWSGPNSGPVC